MEELPPITAIKIININRGFIFIVIVFFYKTNENNIYFKLKIFVETIKTVTSLNLRNHALV